MILSLPWPPSANTYWRHPSRGPLAGRHLISERGRAYRQAVCLQTRALIACGFGQSQRIGVVITAYPPDRRRRDLDNVCKASLDALTAAGLWADDSQIDDLRIVRGDIEPDGRLCVKAYEILPGREHEPTTIIRRRSALEKKI